MTTTSTSQPDLNSDSNSAINNPTETLSFDAQIPSLMSTIINNIYSDKDLCFRELISNASDACDKYSIKYHELCDLNFNNLTKPSDLNIKINVLPDHNLITIKDSGIGMTKQEIKDFIGRISRSGTKEFKENTTNYAKSKDAQTLSSVSSMIGQFGLGFYSSFLIADKVAFVSRSAYENKSTLFYCESVDKYELTDLDSNSQNSLYKPLDSHGTIIYLHVRKNDEKFLSVEKVEEIVKKYSVFIVHAIYLIKHEEREVDDDEELKLESGKENEERDIEDGDVQEKVEEVKDKVKEEEEEDKDEPKDDDKLNDDNKVEELNDKVEELGDKVEDDSKVKDDSKVEELSDTPTITESEPAPKKVKKIVPVSTRINADLPLWLIPPSQVSKDQYTKFYKTISDDWDDYLTVKHTKLEGNFLTLTLLLFIPKRNKNSFFDKQNDKKTLETNIKVYVNNVFVTSNLPPNIFPEWLHFVSGVIYSDDLPMNVSRELFQGDNTSKMIKNNLVKKIVETISELKDDDYNGFMKEFGNNVKIGVRESVGKNYEDKLVKLLRFSSNMSRDTPISLDEYIERKEERIRQRQSKSKSNLNENDEGYESEKDNNDNKSSKSKDNNKDDDNKLDLSEFDKDILVLTGLNKEEVSNSPYLSLFPNEEILLMHEPVDEVMLQTFTKYKQYQIKRITSDIIQNKTYQLKDESIKKEYEEFIKEYTKVLDKYIDKINLKYMPEDIPCIVKTNSYSYSPAMEQLIRNQPGAENNPMISMMCKTKKIFDINLVSPVIRNLKRMYDDEDSNSKEDAMWKLEGEIVYLTSMIQCGFRIEDGTVYAKKIFELLKLKNESKKENKNDDEEEEKKEKVSVDEVL